MELPASVEDPSPFLQQAQTNTAKQSSEAILLKQAAVARSLMLSSSCPVDVGQWLQLGGVGPFVKEDDDDSKDDKDAQLASSVSSTSSTSPNSTSPAASTTILGSARPTILGTGKQPTPALDMSRVKRKDSMLQEDKRFSVDALSKSPTVFGFLADANKRSPPASSRSTVSYNRLSKIDTSKKGANTDSKTDDDVEDLQFAISLDKEDDGFLDDSPDNAFVGSD
jgi:hypothetical protein